MYNAHDINERMIAAFRGKYPNWRSLRLIVSSTPGGGKSTLLASTPIPEGKTRLILDNEDSMAYLDAGREGVDVYTPNTLQFKMIRFPFPTIEDYAKVFQTIVQKPESIGAICIDNIAVFQDTIHQFLTQNASTPKIIVDTYAKFGAAHALPNTALIATWSRNQDGNYWRCAKLIPTAFLLQCSKSMIHFVGSTEEGNVWENYGKTGAKIVGKQAKIWDVWYRYTDLVISLVRDVNKREPPKGQLYPNQPKNRIQGLNPTWIMDWEGFVKELQEANKRTSKDIPQNLQVHIEETVEEFPG